MRLPKPIRFLFLLFIYWGSFAQEYGTTLEGRVFSTDGDVAATHVFNMSTKRGAITDASGYFKITVSLNDTLVFSAVQYKRKEIIVNLDILETESLKVILENTVTELDEVVVMPYNLSGILSRDTRNLKLTKLVSARTEKLPNAALRAPTQTERKLFAATDLDCNCTGTKLDPLLNYFSGRTKMLKERAALDEEVYLHEIFRTYFDDDWYETALKIPKSEIENFMYYCELDTAVVSQMKANNQLQLIELMKTKSIDFRKQNKLDK